MRVSSAAFSLAATLSLCASGAAHSQQQPELEPQASQTSVRESENEVGKSYKITADSFPKPYTEESVRNPPVIVPRNGAKPNLPDGFEAQLFASGLNGPRRIRFLPNGDAIVAMQQDGTLMLLRDSDKDGEADWIQRFAGGFNAPYGIAWREGEVLVADQDGIWRIPHKLGNVRASYGSPSKESETPPEARKPQTNADRQELLTEKGVFGDVTGHRNRDLAIGPDGRLYVGVGSGGNIGVEPPVKATIQVFSASGANQQTLAEGLRNPTTLAFHPETGELWAGVQERDHMGDKLVPDYLADVKEGEDYGWPYFYAGGNQQPDFAKIKEAREPGERKAEIAEPEAMFESHSAVMGLAFDNGKMLPGDYKGDAFAALKGSWNKAEPTGYKVVRVPFENGKPTGTYENFVTGFWVSGEDRAEVWGRPADVAQAPDGSLYIVDDTGGTIWRVIPEKGAVAQKESPERKL